MHIIAVFFTTHHTLSAEKILKKNKIKNKIIMKPRKITTDCGLALEFDGEFFKTAYSEFLYAKLKLEGFYKRDENEWVKISVEDLI